MRLAVLQMRPSPADLEANFAAVARAARAAAAAGAAALVAPEMALTGYAVWDSVAHLAEPRDGPAVTRLCALARREGIAVAAGFPERDGDAVFNAVAVAFPDGAPTQVYRKCHLFGPHERACFAAGSAFSPLFDLGGLRTGLLVCYDVEFPEAVRALALAGAELLLVPTALPLSGPNDRVSRALVPARALENGLAIAYAGLCGDENGLAYQGGSALVDAAGEDLARAGRAPALLIADIPPRGAGATAPDPYLADRRPELYAGR